MGLSVYSLRISSIFLLTVTQLKYKSFLYAKGKLLFDMPRFWILFFLLFLLIQNPVSAFSPSLKEGHRMFLGAEVYHLTRETERGAVQRGELHGARGVYERKRRYSPYWAFEGAFTKGDARGHTASKLLLISEMSELEIDFRGGYTFGCKNGIKPSFTPFLGYGYYQGKNKFSYPSPIPCQFDTCVHFASTGFIADIWWKWVSLTLKFSAKYLFDGENKISEDPDREDQTQEVGSAWSFDVTLPIYIRLCDSNDHFRFTISPFWRVRRFGGWYNFPSDFYKTKIHNYGGTLFLGFFF